MKGRRIFLVLVAVALALVTGAQVMAQTTWTIADPNPNPVPNNGTVSRIEVQSFEAGVGAPKQVQYLVLNVPAGVTVEWEGFPGVSTIETASDGTATLLVSSTAPTSGTGEVDLIEIGFRDVAADQPLGTKEVNFVQGPPEGSRSTLQASTNTAQINETVTFTVTAIDETLPNGNPVRDRQIRLQANQNTGITISNAGLATTNESGVATFTVTSTLPYASPGVTFTAFDVPTNEQLGSASSVVFNDLPISESLSQVNFTNPADSNNTISRPADNTTTTEITVYVRNTANQPINGASVTLNAFVGSNAATTGVRIDGNTTSTATKTSGSSGGEQGVARFTIIGSVPNNVRFEATANGTAITENVTISFTTPPPDQGNSTLVPNKTTAIANNADPVTLTFTALSVSNQAVGGLSVVLEAISGVTVGPTGDVDISPAGTTTQNGTGVAVFTVTARPSAAGKVGQFRVRSTNPNIEFSNDVVSLTFQASPPASANSSLVRTPTNITPVQANGVDAATVVVTLRNSQNAAVNNRDVTLTAVASNGATVTIDGVASPVEKSTTGGGDADNVATFLIRAQGPAQAPFTVTVTAQDTTDPGSPINVGSGANGTQLVINFRDPDFYQPNSSIVIADANGNPPTQQNPSKSSVFADNTDDTDVLVTLRDESNNPIGGATVRLDATRVGGGNLTGLNINGTEQNSATATTDANGVARFTISGDVVQGVNFTATVTSQDPDALLQGNVTVTFVSAPFDPDLTEITVTPADKTLDANNTETGTITVELNDQGGGPVSGQALRIVLADDETDQTGVVFLNTVAGTNAEGIAQFQIRGTIQRTVEFDIVTDPGDTQVNDEDELIFNFVGATGTTPVVAANSCVAIEPNTLTANGVATARVTVTLRDSTGNVIVGKTASGSALLFTEGGNISSNPASVTITPVDNDNNGGTPIVSNNSGQLVWDISSTSTTQRNFTISGNVEGLISNACTSNDNQLQINPGGITSVSPTKSTIEFTNGTDGVALANGSDNIQIKVTLRNDSDQAVANTPVSLSFSPANASVQGGVTQQTNGSGEAVFTLTSQQATGLLQVIATGGGVELTNRLDISFNSLTNINATASSVLVTDGNAIANDTDTVKVTVTVLDNQSTPQPVANASVRLSIALGGVGTINAPNPTTTDSQGQAFFTLDSTQVGTGTVRATVEGPQPGAVDDVTIADSPNDTYIFTSGTGPGGVDATNSEIIVSPSGNPPTVNLPNTFQVTVQLRNGSNTGVPNQPVTLLVSGPAGASAAPQQQTTNGTGDAVFTVSATQPGTYTLSARVGASFEFQDDPIDQIVFNPNPAVPSASASTIVATDANGTAGLNSDPGVIVVTVRDASNNPIQGRDVNLISSRGNVDVITESNGGISGPTGEVTFTVTSAQAGTATFTAQIVNSPSPINVNGSAQIVFQPSVVQAPVVTITKSNQGVTSFSAGGQGSFLITLANAVNSPSSTSGQIIVTDALQGGVTFVNATSNNNEFQCSGTTTVTCFFNGTIPVGQTRSVLLNVNIPANFSGSILTNSASATGGGFQGTITTNPIVTNITPINPNTPSNASTLQLNPTSVATNTDSTVTFRLLNQSLTGISNATVRLVPSSTNGVIVSLPAAPGVANQTTITDANGNATFLVRSSVPQSFTFNVEVSNVPGVSGTTTLTYPSLLLTVTGTSTGTGVASPTTSTVTTDFSQIPANGTTAATITVKVSDANNQALANKTVSVSGQPAGQFTVTPINPVTNAGGVATFQVRATGQTPPSATFSAVVTETGGQQVFIQQTVTITFGAATSQPIAATAVAGTPGTGTPGAGGASATAQLSLLNPPSVGPQTGRVTASRLNVRTCPSITSERLGLLAVRTQVVLLARNPRGSWYLIDLGDGAVGWVSSRFISTTRANYRALPVVDGCDATPVASLRTVVPGEGQGRGIVSRPFVNVRAEPNLGGAVLLVVRQGDEVVIVGKDVRIPNWYLIIIDPGDPNNPNDDTYGWIAVNLVRLIEPRSARFIPVVEYTTVPRPQ